MNDELKDKVAETVLGVLNDATKWHDLFNMMDGVPYLHPKVPIDKSKESDVKFDVPVKKLFSNDDGKTPNSFKLNRPEKD